MVEWAAANITEILGIAVAVVGVATLIARLTPTSKDDEVVGVIKKFLDNFSLGGINKGATKDK